MALTDPDSYNWLFHQKLIHSNSNFLPKLDTVDKSFYAEYSNGIINRQNGKIAESLSCFRSLLKKEPTLGNFIELQPLEEMMNYFRIFWTAGQRMSKV